VASIQIRQLILWNAMARAPLGEISYGFFPRSGKNLEPRDVRRPPREPTFAGQTRRALIVGRRTQ
jgi:hypothetical protein